MTYLKTIKIAILIFPIIAFLFTIPFILNQYHKYGSINKLRVFIIYSFIGWVIEVIYVYYDEDKLVNRGFLIGPCCPIYGVSSILMIFLLDKYKPNLEVLFVMAVLICTITEYLTSLIMEKLFNTRWWDYSKQKFNLNGRICLKTSIAFGLLGVLLIYVINPFISSLLLKFNPIVLIVVSSIFLIVFLIDLCISFNIISKLELNQVLLKIDNTDTISRKVREKIASKSILMKRLINAFPGFKITNINKIKERIKKKKKK